VDADGARVGDVRRACVTARRAIAPIARRVDAAAAAEYRRHRGAPRYARVRAARARAHVRGASARGAAAPAVGGRRELDAGARAEAVPAIAGKRAAGLRAGGHCIDDGGGARVAAHAAVGGVRQVDALSAAHGKPVRTASVRGYGGGVVPRICCAGFNPIRGVQAPADVVRTTVVERGEAALLARWASLRVTADRFA
jgi:hypothetical protein